MAERRTALAAVLAAALVAAAGAAAAGSPVSGSVSGPVTSVKGATFTLTTSLSPTGKSTIDVGSATVITEQATGTRAELTKGACVMAVGKRSTKGVVSASRITLTQQVKGQCASGFTRGNGTRPGGGAPPSGGQRPPGGFGGFANFGFAFGTVSAVKGSTLTVKGPRGTTTVTVPASVQIVKTEHVGSSAIAVKLCAFVRGTSTDKGVVVKAQDVGLSKPSASGCSFGFRRP